MIEWMNARRPAGTSWGEALHSHERRSNNRAQRMYTVCQCMPVSYGAVGASACLTCPEFGLEAEIVVRVVRLDDAAEEHRHDADHAERLTQQKRRVARQAEQRCTHTRYASSGILFASAPSCMLTLFSGTLQVTRMYSYGLPKASCTTRSRIY